MSLVVDAESFLESHRLPIIDVRSPGEFGSGHIPSAHNVPLLDDRERAEVGTIYKQIGPDPAIVRGRELVEVKTDRLVQSVQAVASGPEVLVHCWRGGMRSEGFASLLEQHGFKPCVLHGGYKAYRQAAHRGFAKRRRIVILSGHTGSGKTQILHGLRAAGEQIIDLERLANHRGSAFGGIGQPPQPSVEQFENDLFRQWRELDPNRPVWIEGESQSIGKAFIPQPVWDQMTTACTIFVEVERTQRIQFLVEEYGELPHAELAAAMERISRRLGGARLQAALQALRRKDVHRFAELALEYYDIAYSKSLRKHPRRNTIHLPLAGPGQPDSMEKLCRLGSELVS